MIRDRHGSYRGRPHAGTKKTVHPSIFNFWHRIIDFDMENSITQKFLTETLVLVVFLTILYEIPKNSIF